MRCKTDAPSAAVSTPSVASSSLTPVKASDAISSDTVNPIPAIAPPPSTEAHPTGGLMRPPLSFVTRNVPPLIPIGLPTM